MSDRDDRIELMARAHREVVDGSSTRAARTRAAILSIHAERRARRTWLLVAAAALLTLVSAPTAWALYTQTGPFSRLPPPSETRPDPTSEPPSAADHRAVSRLDEAARDESDVVEPVEVTPPAWMTSERPRPPVALVAVPADARAAVDRAPVDPVERRAYEEAHRMHFDTGDPARAIALWDRYLAGYPRGRFAPEASYNRGLALIRVGRRAEAIQALTPFANGAHGSYRRAEATELLSALGPPP